MTSDNLILSKVNLQEQMTWTPGKTIFNESLFQIYVSEEYQNSSRKESDESYGMSEIVVLHKTSGLRLVCICTEDYSGDLVTYKLYDLFIIAPQNKKLRPTDMNVTEKYFITCEGEIRFSNVNKYDKE